MPDDDAMTSEDFQRRNASMARLESKGWFFRQRMQDWGVYNMSHDGGRTHWFGNGEDALTKAVKYANHAQARLEMTK